MVNMAQDPKGKAGNKLAAADIRGYIHNLKEFSTAVGHIETRMAKINATLHKGTCNEAPTGKQN